MDHRGFAINPNQPITQSEYELDIIMESDTF